MLESVGLSAEYYFYTAGNPDLLYFSSIIEYRPENKDRGYKYPVDKKGGVLNDI